MKRKQIFLAAFSFLCSCSSNDEVIKDMNDPIISDEGIVANPIDCQVYKRGEIIPFHYIFSDNIELGYYVIDIHQNFDHHVHGTSAIDCEQEEKTTDVSGWVFKQDYNIPNNMKSYTARVDIPIPTTIEKIIDKDTIIMPLQTGDYHFMIRLTDHAGCQALKAMAIKIVE